jgi:hypothetical protein
MRKPWSISTTVRTPERLRDFLAVLKNLEGQQFSKNNQIKYQVLLIREKVYKPLNIPPNFRKYYEKPELQMPYKIAKEIFYTQNYKDPPMRGRQSVNPLNKLGFSIAREGYGPIKITSLGNLFLKGDYDIGFIFFKSLLKLQFPNPWSIDFSKKEGFNIMPFVAVLHLLHRLNQRDQIKGLSKEEFCLFVPTLINANKIDEQIEKIQKFRKLKGKKEKRKYILSFSKQFYKTTQISQKKINNLFDYGDNIMRYFRLTRYFRVETDVLGRYWRFDLEPTRLMEIEQIIKRYNGEALTFKNIKEYLQYISDINQPELPWEKLGNLQKIAFSLNGIIKNFIEKWKIKLEPEEAKLLESDIKSFDRGKLVKYIEDLRELNLNLRLILKKKGLVGNIDKIREIIKILKYPKLLKQLEPHQFEKLLTEALRVLNDELLIKPNYPVDDEGEPISHSPGNKPDIECYYSNFKAICEVTLNTSNLQWVQEGQPVMRHLRDFENQHGFKDTFCIFIAPRIHTDTYSQFWVSVKYEYNGKPQRIIPLTTQQFIILLKKLLNYIEEGKKFNNKELYILYEKLVKETQNVNSFSDWANKIPQILKNWAKKEIL